MLKKILFLMPYFGKWPEWFPLYLESCRWNPTIDWLFFTDCPVPQNAPKNVVFVSLSFADYQKLVSQKLEINFQTVSPYKICDLRPAFGFIHQEYLQGYDYFGFSDIDIIYGDIRAFYTDEVLRYSTLSTHPDRVSGHLFLFKNNEQWINVFRKIPRWQELMSHPSYLCLDEGALTKVLIGSRRIPKTVRQLWGILDADKRNHLFQERCSTVLAHFPWMDGTDNYPDNWFWHRGKLTVESGEEMMYLHFMNWKSKQYLRQRYGEQAAWESLPQIVSPQLTDLSQGFCISHLGFTPLESKDHYL